MAKKCGFIVFPTVSYGISDEHSPLFNTSIATNTLRTILSNIINSLLDNGVKDFCILNGHHGNVGSLRYFMHGMVPIYSYWHFMEHEFDHAGFVETSLMLAISDKVRMKKAKKGLIMEN